MEQREMFVRREKEGNPIAMHEMLYPLFVGYDSVVLDVDCEIGGTDQEFNMLAGRTLQKAFGKREKFVLTTKLLEGSDGRKMSKTYDNCVYLDDEPKDMFGKVMSIKDELIPAYFECCTDIAMKEIGDIEKKMKKGENPVDFKKRLAHEIVRMYHGSAAADAAANAFASQFTKGETPDDMPEIRAEKGSGLLEVLVKAKLVPSKSEGRRLIEQKGITLNNKIVQKVDAVVEEGVVKVGKRKFGRIVF
jgi:tyrosyl-tRNA synthetase